MLYYIIPPIIIILSLSVLIFFLFRKVSDLPEGAIVIEQKPTLEWRKVNRFLAALGHFGLKLLERLMQKAKLFSLKFHNTSNDWFHSIKKKREEHVIKQQQQEQAEVTEDDQPEIEMRVTRPDESSQKNVSELNGQIRRSVTVEEDSPVVIRRSRQAMVSAKVTRPEKKAVLTKAKNKLEDALIKRIAVNPRDIEAYERLGDYYIEQNNLADALECYRQVLRLSPVHHKAKMKIRKIERVMGRKL